MHGLIHIKNIYICTCMYIYIYIYSRRQKSPSGPGPNYRDFAITLRHITPCRTPLDKWSARRRNLNLSAHSTHKRHTSIPSARFEPAIPKTARPETHPLNCSATSDPPDCNYAVWKSDSLPNRRLFFFSEIIKSLPSNLGLFLLPPLPTT